MGGGGLMSIDSVFGKEPLRRDDFTTTVSDVVHLPPPGCPLAKPTPPQTGQKLSAADPEKMKTNLQKIEKDFNKYDASLKKALVALAVCGVIAAFVFGGPAGIFAALGLQLALVPAITVGGGALLAIGITASAGRAFQVGVERHVILKKLKEMNIENILDLIRDELERNVPDNILERESAIKKREELQKIQQFIWNLRERVDIEPESDMPVRDIEKEKIEELIAETEKVLKKIQELENAGEVIPLKLLTGLAPGQTGLQLLGSDIADAYARNRKDNVLRELLIQVTKALVRIEKKDESAGEARVDARGCLTACLIFGLGLTTSYAKSVKKILGNETELLSKILNNEKFKKPDGSYDKEKIYNLINGIMNVNAEATDIGISKDQYSTYINQMVKIGSGLEKVQVKLQATSFEQNPEAQWIMKVEADFEQLDEETQKYITEVQFTNYTNLDASKILEEEGKRISGLTPEKQIIFRKYLKKANDVNAFNHGFIHFRRPNIAVGEPRERIYIKMNKEKALELAEQVTTKLYCDNKYSAIVDIKFAGPMCAGRDDGVVIFIAGKTEEEAQKSRDEILVALEGIKKTKPELFGKGRHHFKFNHGESIGSAPNITSDVGYTDIIAKAIVRALAESPNSVHGLQKAIFEHVEQSIEEELEKQAKSKSRSLKNATVQRV